MHLKLHSSFAVDIPGAKTKLPEQILSILILRVIFQRCEKSDALLPAKFPAQQSALFWHGVSFPNSARHLRHLTRSQVGPVFPFRLTIPDTNKFIVRIICFTAASDKAECINGTNQMHFIGQICIVTIDGQPGHIQKTCVKWSGRREQLYQPRISRIRITMNWFHWS